jgi:hypothetical protein
MLYQGYASEIGVPDGASQDVLGRRYGMEKDVFFCCALSYPRFFFTRFLDLCSYQGYAS